MQHNYTLWYCSCCIIRRWICRAEDAASTWNCSAVISAAGAPRYYDNDTNNLPLLELQTHRYNYTVNKQQAVTQYRNGTAQKWSVCNKAITQFLPATHAWTFPCLYSQPQGITTLWLVLLRLPKKGWPGWVDLCGWLYTEINFWHREIKQGTVTHLSTN